mmetsp:Transcript_15938/g.37597  ORF Transcript_15938/g.37597 Transcript_15938/m.37597 type:complete len:238 (+) Transcript_15938:549-1262(+)
MSTASSVGTTIAVNRRPGLSPGVSASPSMSCRRCSRLFPVGRTKSGTSTARSTSVTCTPNCSKSSGSVMPSAAISAGLMALASVSVLTSSVRESVRRSSATTVKIVLVFMSAARQYVIPTMCSLGKHCAEPQETLPAGQPTALQTVPTSTWPLQLVATSGDPRSVPITEESHMGTSVVVVEVVVDVVVAVLAVVEVLDTEVLVLLLAVLLEEAVELSDVPLLADDRLLTVDVGVVGV